MLDVVRLNDVDERMLRVRRLTSAGKPNLAALLPASLMLPAVASDGSVPINYIRLTLPDGTLVGSAGAEPTAIDDSRVLSRQRSERYGPVVNVVMPRERRDRHL